MIAARQRGFTLLEVLVAVGIFALFSVMAYTALNQLIKTRERLDSEREFWRALSLTFLRMQDDLAQARPRTVRDIRGECAPALRAQPTDIRVLGAPSLEFTRGGVPLPYVDKKPDELLPDGDPPPRSDLLRVGYRLQDKVLSRLSWTQLDRSPGSEPKDAPLLHEVEDFQVRAYDQGWETLWPRLAPTGLAGCVADLPRGLEVKLTVTGRGEFTRVFLIHE